jgi:hypothetical protein
MQYLMIHDIRKEYFDLSLDQYRLTFDDGLFSQYYYYPVYKNHPENLTFFITTSFIRPGKSRSMFAGEYLQALKPKKYMYRCFIENKFDHFMTTEEIQELSTKPNVQVGVHSHWHDVILTRTHASKRKPASKWKLARFQDSPEISRQDLSIRSKIAFQGFDFQEGSLRRRSSTEWEDYIKADTELCLKWVMDNLGFTPDMYCFPFNEYHEKLISILKSFGFNKFFAARPGENIEIIGRKDIDSLVGDKI